MTATTTRPTGIEPMSANDRESMIVVGISRVTLAFTVIERLAT